MPPPSNKVRSYALTELPCSVTTIHKWGARELACTVLCVQPLKCSRLLHGTQNRDSEAANHPCAYHHACIHICVVALQQHHRKEVILALSPPLSRDIVVTLNMFAYSKHVGFNISAPSPPSPNSSAYERACRWLSTELYINISPGPAGKRLFTMRDSIYLASNVLKRRASPPNLSACERACR